MKKDPLNVIFSILSIAIMSILWLYEIMLVFLDFNKFTSSGGFGWKPTNRVAFVGGLLTSFVGVVFGLSYYFNKRFWILSFVNKLTASNQKNVLLILSVMCLALGLSALIAAIMGYYIST